MKLWKQAACAALAAALLLTAGCGDNDKAWAYRAGDVEPPVGVYIYNMLASISEADEKLHEAHDQDDEDNEPPPYKQLLKETLDDGTTVADYIRARGEEKTREFIAVEQEFADLGLALDEAELTYAKTTAEETWKSDPYYETNGIAENTLRLIMENSFKRQALFDAIYGSEGTQAVSESQLKELLQKDYIKMEYLMAAKDMAEGADNSALKATMEGYRDRVAGGEDFYDIIHEYEKDQAVKNAVEGETPAEIARPEPGSRSMILYEGYRDYYGDELVDGALAAAVGRPTVIEDDYTFYLIVRQDILADPADFEGYREDLLEALKSEEFEQLIAGWASTMSIEINQPALERYTASRLKIAE